MGETKERIMWTGVFVLTLVIGFFAGRVSVKVDLASPTPMRDIGQVSQTLPTVTLESANDNAVQGTYTGDVRILTKNTAAEQRNGMFSISSMGLLQGSGGQAVNAPLDAAYPYVASKNSDLYHVISAPSSTRIKPENRVYFKTREEAEKKGFRPGADVQ